MHLILTSAAEIGFAWDGDEQGWIRAPLLPLGILAGSIQHFQSAIFEAWQLKISAQLADRKGFRGVSSWNSEDLYNLLISSHLRDFVKAKDEDVRCRFWRWASVLGLHLSPSSPCSRAPRVRAPHGA